jgi:hypothetical protein
MREPDAMCCVILAATAGERNGPGIRCGAGAVAHHSTAAHHPLMVISGVSSTTGRARPAPVSVSTTGPIPL